MTNIFKLIVLKCFLQIQWQFVPNGAIQIIQDKCLISLSHNLIMSLNLFTVEIVISFAQASHFCCCSLKSGRNKSKVVAKLRNNDTLWLLYNYKRCLTRSSVYQRQVLNTFSLRQDDLHFAGDISNKFVRNVVSFKFKWNSFPKA